MIKICSEDFDDLYFKKFKDSRKTLWIYTFKIISRIKKNYKSTKVK